MRTILFAAFLFSVWSTSVHAQADFYKGKTIRLVIGYTAGGTNDLWARAIARFWGKYIPGNPVFIVQNMPGGGKTPLGAGSGKRGEASSVGARGGYPTTGGHRAHERGTRKLIEAGNEGLNGLILLVSVALRSTIGTFGTGFVFGERSG